MRRWHNAYAEQATRVRKVRVNFLFTSLQSEMNVMIFCTGDLKKKRNVVRRQPVVEEALPFSRLEVENVFRQDS